MIGHRTILALMVAACIVLETAEQSFFRVAGRAMGNQRRYAASVAPAIVAHVTRLLVWYVVLRELELAVAVPLMGATYLTVAVAGRIFFHEGVDGRRWVGTGLIVAGFVMVASHAQ